MCDKNSTFSIAAVGDMLMCRRVSVYSEPEYQAVLKVLREQDAAFGNCETTICTGIRRADMRWPNSFQGFYREDYCGFLPYRGECWTASPWWVADEMKWMGFNLINCAQNCSGEYSQAGFLSTMDALEKAGLCYAGIGRNLGEARSPGYLDTKKGRVALVGTCMWYEPGSRAGEARVDEAGSPGISGIRTYVTLDKEGIDRLKKVLDDTGLSKVLDAYDSEDAIGRSFQIFDNRILYGDVPGHMMDHRDVEANMKWLSHGKRMADWSFFSNHYHQTSEKGWLISPCEERPQGVPTVPSVIERLARKAIDSGADGCFFHGPHRLQGVEIYKNKPIFYGLGDFIATHESTEPQPQWVYDWFGMGLEAPPSDMFDRYGAGILDSGIKSGIFSYQSLEEKEDYWWEGVIGVSQFDINDQKLVDLRLYPVWLMKEKRRSQRGRPIALWTPSGDRARAKKIIHYIGKASEPYGTEIIYKDGVGVAKL